MLEVLTSITYGKSGGSNLDTRRADSQAQAFHVSEVRLRIVFPRLRTRAPCQFSRYPRGSPALSTMPSQNCEHSVWHRSAVAEDDLNGLKRC